MTPFHSVVAIRRVDVSPKSPQWSRRRRGALEAFLQRSSGTSRHTGLVLLGEFTSEILPRFPTCLPFHRQTSLHSWKVYRVYSFQACCLFLCLHVSFTSMELRSFNAAQRLLERHRQRYLNRDTLRHHSRNQTHQRPNQRPNQAGKHAHQLSTARLALVPALIIASYLAVHGAARLSWDERFRAFRSRGPPGRRCFGSTYCTTHETASRTGLRKTL